MMTPTFSSSRLSARPITPLRELDQLARHHVREAVDARDAVADLDDGADVRGDGLDAELLDLLSQDRCDLFRSYCHLSTPVR